MFRLSDIKIVINISNCNDFDHYPEGYDPTDPNRPTFAKPSHANTDIKSAEILHNSNSISTSSIIVDEIAITDNINNQDGLWLTASKTLHPSHSNDR